MQIRIAEEVDVRAVLDIYAPYVEHTTYTFEYEVPSLEEMLERFRKVTAYFPWIVVEEDGEIIGYAYAERIFARAAYQWDADSAVYLSEDCRGRGIAATLYEGLEEFLRIQGFHNIYALVTSENTGSMRFHEKHGYRETALFRKTGYKFGKWLDVTWYEKRLCEAVEPGATRAFHELGTREVQRIIDKMNDIYRHDMK